MSPNGATNNQIDHRLIDRRFVKSTVDVQSKRGAECGTDHYLVLSRVRQRIKI